MVAARVRELPNCNAADLRGRENCVEGIPYVFRLKLLRPLRRRRIVPSVHGACANLRNDDRLLRVIPAKAPHALSDARLNKLL